MIFLDSTRVLSSNAQQTDHNFITVRKKQQFFFYSENKVNFLTTFSDKLHKFLGERNCV